MRKRALIRLSIFIFLLLFLILLWCIFVPQSVTLEWGCFGQQFPYYFFGPGHDMDLETFLCDFFHLQVIELEPPSVEIGWRYPRYNLDYFKILSALRSAEYVPCEKKMEDHEYVFLNFRNVFDRPLKTMMLAYRYIDSTFLAFVDGQCYEVRNGEKLRAEMGEVFDVPQDAIVAFQSHTFWYTRFFHNGKRTEKAIRDGFINTMPEARIDYRRAKELGEREIELRLDTAQIPRYDLYTDNRASYDKYADMWNVRIRIGFADVTGEFYAERTRPEESEHVRMELNVLLKPTGETVLILGDVDLLMALAKEGHS